MGEASERQRVEKLGLEEMLGLAGGMEHAESAKESEDIYQKSLGDMDKGNLKSLQQLTKQVKNVARPDTPYYYTDEGLVDMPRQIQSRFMPQQEELEPMMNPFTGEPLEDFDLSTASPYVRGKLSLAESGLGYKGSDEERMDESAMSMFPEAYQDKPKSWLQRLLGRQMGGMMPGGVSNALPYNLGGSVQQQPMAYQLGGLLKYKRSPMMG